MTFKYCNIFLRMDPVMLHICVNGMMARSRMKDIPKPSVRETMIDHETTISQQQLERQVKILHNIFLLILY